MPTVIINGQVIDIPNSGGSPNWAPAIIEGFQAIEAALNLSLGLYDIAPQTFNLLNNINTNLDLPNLTFPTSAVAGAVITYTIFRESDTQTHSETGIITLNYNESTGVFSLGREFSGGKQSDGQSFCSFSVTPSGQVQLTTVGLSGVYTSGKITYSAKAQE